MPIFHVNFDTRPGSKALSRLSRNGNELVKAMQLKDRADSQQSGGGNATTTTSAGSAQGHDQFKKTMLNLQGQIEGLNETSRQLDEGGKLLRSVIKMVTNPSDGILKVIRRIKETWLSITQTGRELQNDDMHKIFKIRGDIENILSQFGRLRYNGISVFARRVNIQNNKTLSFSNAKSARNNQASNSVFSDSSRGANIDFIRQYEDIRQNLDYVQENITSYARKMEVTRNLENAERSANQIVSISNNQLNKFSGLAGNIYWTKKRTVSERDETIRQRQNQLSVEAVVSLLENQNGVNTGI